MLCQVKILSILTIILTKNINSKLFFKRAFSGFAGDEEFETETKKLGEILEKSELKTIESKCICISYDPPFKLFGRRNEVILLSV
jgi:hypothetical protein